MSNFFTTENGVLTFRRRRETLRIEGWGANGLRVRSTENRDFTPHDWALTEAVEHTAKAWVEDRPTRYGYDETIAIVENGNFGA